METVLKQDDDVDVLLIDANGIGYAAMYQPNLSNLSHNGKPTAALHGLMQSMFSLIKSHPKALPVVLWDGHAQWRKDIHPEYKSKRHITPEKQLIRDLYRQQATILRLLLLNFGIPQIRHPDFEADDLAGMICGQRDSDDREPIDQAIRIKMITKDTDWMQNIRHNVSWYSTTNKKLITIDALSDPAIMKEDCYHSPEEYIRCKALSGDTSDGIAGVDKVGMKTAVKLYREHGSFEQFWKKIDDGMSVSKATDIRIVHMDSRATYRRNMRLMDWRESPTLDPDTLSAFWQPQDMSVFSDLCLESGLEKILTAAHKIPLEFTQKNHWNHITRVLGL